MKARTAIRKTVKWGGAGAVVLLVAVWVASGWWWVQVMQLGRTELAFRYGRVDIRVLYTNRPPGPSFSAAAGANLFPAYFDWGYSCYAHGSSTSWWIPLWIPTLLVAIPAALAWRADRRAIFRARPGRCPDCGYDRRGLAAGGVCPECGAAANAGAAS